MVSKLTKGIISLHGNSQLLRSQKQLSMEVRSKYALLLSDTFIPDIIMMSGMNKSI